MNKKILLMVVVLLLIPLVSATINFDDWKTYDKENKEYTLSQVFGLGREIAKVKLNSEYLEVLGIGYQQVAEFEIRNGYYNYEKIIKNIELYDINNDMEEVVRDVDYKYKVYETITHYEYNCKKEIEKNGTIIDVCNEVYAGERQVERWEIWDSNSLIKDENIIIGIFTDTQEGDHIEWILKIYGNERLTKWATWDASLNNGLVSFWKMDEGSGLVIDGVGSNDLSNTGPVANTTGLINSGYEFSGSSPNHLNRSSINEINKSRDYFINGWIKPDDKTTAQTFLGHAIDTNDRLAIELENGEARARVYTPDVTVGGTYTPNTNEWSMISFIHFSNDTILLLVNNVSVTGGSEIVSTQGNSNFAIGVSNSLTHEPYDGDGDEWGVWNRTPTQTELDILYNNRAGNSPPITFPPTIILNSPTNNANFFTPIIDFNCTAGDNSGITNVSLIVNGTVRQTNSSGFNGTWYQFTETITTGTGFYNWTCQAYDDDDDLGLAGVRNFTYSNGLTISLNAPVNAFNSTSQTIIFNGTGSDDTSLINISVIVNGSYNGTNSSVFNNTYTTFSRVLAEGFYNWTMEACDDLGVCINATTRNITIDNTAPTYIVYSPIGSQITYSLPYNASLNFTVSDFNLDSCWYSTNDNSTNITYTCNNLVNITFTTGGDKVIYSSVNDTLGNTNATAIEFLLNYLIVNVTYEDPVIEAQDTNIYLNLTASNITSLNGTLWYNDTAYVISNTTNGTYGLLSRTISLPLVTSNTNASILWTYVLNGIAYNTSSYNQTIKVLTTINVTSIPCSDMALRFDFQDEDNLTALNGSIEYNFKYGLTNLSLKQTYGSLSDIPTFYVCINASVSEEYVIGYGEIQYTSGAYVERRYYLFENNTISNNTLTNHTLRSLLTAGQTSFLMTFEDTSLNKYVDKYTALWRWYPNLNEYQIVEMGKTDEQGQSVSHIDTEDVDYRVGLYDQDGTLIKLGEPLRFICASAPCTFTLRVGAGDLDYSSFFDVETSLTYNETTKLFTFIYNDPNQLTSEMRLLVTRETGSSTLTICDDTSSGFTGVMACNTSAYTGTKKAIVYRSASPDIPIAQLIVSFTTDIFRSGFGLFISVFLWLAVVLTGLGNNPLWTIILGIVALLPALLLGSINVAIFTGLAVLGAIVIHFIKRALTR